MLCASSIALALPIGGCGDEGDSSAAAEVFAPVTAPPPDAERGGRLTVLAAGDVDFIDPGATGYQFAYTIDAATQRQLLSWRPDDVREPTPDLAKGPPRVSRDGLTITFRLRRGVRFSPPLGREVECDDFKYAIERALLPGVANGYVTAYLGDVVGFREAVAAAARRETRAPDIEGLRCRDSHTFAIGLRRTSSAGVLAALSLPVGAPVPRDYASEYDAENPSTYGSHQVATGPYMIEGNAAGETTGYVPGKRIELVRNPSWDPETDWRPAYLDSIRVQEGFADVGSAARKVLAGDSQVNGDFTLDPTALEMAAREYPAQLSIVPVGGTRYMPFDTTRPPFDDVDVRKAVIAATDRVELRNTLGGELAGPVASHFIPPGMLGFEQAGGLAGPDLAFIGEPRGDLALAERYMRRAGYASGRCEGECDVTMVGDASPPGSSAAEVFADQLERLGFDVSLHQVAADVMYTRFCQVPANQPNICPNMGWVKVFNDPQGMLQGAFDRQGLASSNNLDWPLLDDRAINRAVKDAALADESGERARAWGRIDAEIVAKAPAVPWNWITQADIRSANVVGVVNRFNAGWDLSFTSLRS